MTVTILEGCDSLPAATRRTSKEALEWRLGQTRGMSKSSTGRFVFAKARICYLRLILQSGKQGTLGERLRLAIRAVLEGLEQLRANEAAAKAILDMENEKAERLRMEQADEESRQSKEVMEKQAQECALARQLRLQALREQALRDQEEAAVRLREQGFSNLTCTCRNGKTCEPCMLCANCAENCMHSSPEFDKSLLLHDGGFWTGKRSERRRSSAGVEAEWRYKIREDGSDTEPSPLFVGRPADSGPVQLPQVPRYFDRMAFGWPKGSPHVPVELPKPSGWAYVGKDQHTSQQRRLSDSQSSTQGVSRNSTEASSFLPVSPAEPRVRCLSPLALSGASPQPNRPGRKLLPVRQPEASFIGGPADKRGAKMPGLHQAYDPTPPTSLGLPGEGRRPSWRSAWLKEKGFFNRLFEELAQLEL